MKKTHILTSVVCLLPVLAGMLLYSRLPEQIVIHWNSTGQPDGWASRFVGAIVLPGILLVINLLFPSLLKMDPRYKNQSGKVQALLHWIIPAVAVFCSSITLAEGMGAALNIPLFGTLFLGLLFIIIGNYLPKMAQSYTIGIKLPWTLADEENWDRTHRFSGRVWVICGFLILITAFLPCMLITLLALAAVMVLAPVAYSYGLYRKKSQAK